MGNRPVAASEEVQGGTVGLEVDIGDTVGLVADKEVGEDHRLYR